MAGQFRPWKHRPRWMHQLFAFVGGYFWLPCDLCGRDFGGHEWRYPLQTLQLGPGKGVGVCPWCAGSSVVRESERQASMGAW